MGPEDHTSGEQEMDPKSYVLDNAQAKGTSRREDGVATTLTMWNKRGGVCQGNIAPAKRCSYNPVYSIMEGMV